MVYLLRRGPVATYTTFHRGAVPGGAERQEPVASSVRSRGRAGPPRRDVPSRGPLSRLCSMAPTKRVDEVGARSPARAEQRTRLRTSEHATTTRDRGDARTNRSN